MKQVLQKSIVLIVFLIPNFSVIAQKKPDFKQQGFGKSGRDMLKAIIQNKKGEYVLVGSSASWFLSNDDDIFFTKHPFISKYSPKTIFGWALAQ